MADQVMASSEFKTHCLRILDEVARSGVAVVVTKRGRPVARLVPLDETPAPSLRGSVRWADDTDPLASVEDAWDAEASPAARAGQLGASGFHGDPADCLIVATALDLGLRLISKDAQIHRWDGIAPVW